ncbi:MAG TPA: hypothetical protein VHB97_08575 [Polyangia bacterium]|jgi:hypothetical protein|nr:hypothetical protein [Polyangia bacterium]
MIRQALVALGPKSVAAGVLVGGAALALGALLVPRAAVAPASGPGMYRLVLHAPEEAGAFYLSAWAEGDVFVPSSDAKTITFVRRGDEHDGCAWQGTERLTRMSTGVYAYNYAETILSCKPDASPFRKTPRTGIVTVEHWAGQATATALNGIQPPGDLWNTAMNDVDCDDQVAADDDDGEDAELTLADAQRQLADAQRELADAQEEVADAVREANEQVKAALAGDDD